MVKLGRFYHSPGGAPRAPASSAQTPVLQTNRLAREHSPPIPIGWQLGRYLKRSWGEFCSDTPALIRLCRSRWANSRLAGFRHAAASELLEEGAPPTVVQRQLRHGDAKTTLQKYGHVVDDSRRRAVNTLAEKIERHGIELESTAELESSVA